MNDHPVITLKPDKEQSVKRFHPWIFSGAIDQKPENLKEGTVVDVADHRGKYLGTGHFQIGSIAVRLVDFHQSHINTDFWRQKLENAFLLRQQMGLLSQESLNMFRLVHGEGDGMPGLIVDVYGRVVVLQCHSIGFYLIRELLAELILEILKDRIVAVYDKSAHSLPYKAPIDPVDDYLIGKDDTWEALEYGNRYYIDVKEGQKTGFFIDQRENRALLKKFAAGRTVLNTFCYTGGFSIAALDGGAERVHSVDSSQLAIDLTHKNIALNFSKVVPHEGFRADAFKYLKKINQEYDLIILDPPAFGKHRKVLPQALKGYRSINQQAIEQIRPGGIIFTFSCSQVVSKEDFRRAVFTASAIAKRDVRVLQQLSQPVDHPINIYHPEGEYLKGLVLQVS